MLSGEAIVSLEAGATLDLNGHTIASERAFAVHCERRCSIISSAATPGILSGIPGVDFTGPHWGINLVRGGVVDNVVIRDAHVAIMSQRGKTLLKNVTLLDSDHGLHARRAILENVTATNVTDAFRIELRLTATNVSISDGNVGILVSQSAGTNGIRYGRVEATGLSVTGNTVYGIKARAIALTDSNVTGNTIDLIAQRSPKLTNTSCGTSQNPADGTSWGVCSLD
jgi:hypothetical protein